jgi:hypothetical protein
MATCIPAQSEKSFLSRQSVFGTPLAVEKFTIPRSELEQHCWKKFGRNHAVFLVAAVDS